MLSGRERFVDTELMMPRTQSRISRVVWWLVGISVWTAVGLFFSVQHLLHTEYLFRDGASWQRSLWSTLPDWYLWGSITPLLFWLVRRFRLEPDAWLWPLAILTFVGLIVAALHVAAAVTIFIALQPAPFRDSWFAQFTLNLVVFYHWNFLVYAAIVGVAHAISYGRDSHQRERRLLHLEASLARSRLAALEMQLQPHFLFNTLGTIAELVHERPDLAEQMIVWLGDLLRQSLASDQPQILLEDELTFNERYLAIESIRFEDRLTTEWQIEPDVRSAYVPRWILQPLVENAVRHGTRRTGGGHITIVARIQNDQLRLEVHDTGRERDTTVERAGAGLGLKNTHERLQQLFGTAFELTLEPRIDGGSTAIVCIPFCTTPSGVFDAD